MKTRILLFSLLLTLALESLAQDYQSHFVQANIAMSQGNYPMAIEETRNAVDSYKKNYGSDTDTYIFLLGHQFVAECVFGDEVNITPSMYLSELRGYIKRHFKTMNSEERRLFSSRYVEMLDTFYVQATHHALMRGVDGGAEAMYDCALLRKELLLSIDRLERSGADDIFSEMYVSSEDVCRALDDRDIAVEFLQCNVDGRDGREKYFAAVCQRGKVTAIPLSDLSPWLNPATVRPDDYYTTDKLYKTLWKPILNRVGEVRNVYFVPDGKYHNVGIEYVPDENGTPICDAVPGRRFYRLSTTRELVRNANALEKSKTQGKSNVAVFAGMNYGAGVPESAIRNGLPKLANTAEEAASIREKCIQAGINPPLLITGDDATETRFKSLSGQDYDVIHLATHGFYVPRERTREYAFLLGDYLKADKSTPDLSLLRSGLAFSGADRVMNRIRIDDGSDDGMLYSREVCDLDLSHCSLLVLSACETGLGDIESDGVFGLQRGFKKAGVGTMVISLDIVYDAVCLKFMDEFYGKLLVEGQSRYDAFHHARRVVKDIWQDPKYWAGFVLLDAME